MLNLATSDSNFLQDQDDKVQNESYTECLLTASQVRPLEVADEMMTERNLVLRLHGVDLVIEHLPVSILP